jgi:tellurite methyltransferase
MSRKDRDRWEKKYAAGNPHAAFTPDPLLTQQRHLLSGKGWALDLCCGVGQNAIFLAEQGFDVLALDTSLTALRYCRAAGAGKHLPLHLVVADVDQFALPADAFALIIVFRFYDRQLIPAIKQALKPGGLIIYQTFNLNRLRSTPHMNRHYLLEPGELQRVLGDFEKIASNDTADIGEELSYWVGRRPGVQS